MMRIACPYCGERDEAEFTYIGSADVVYPPLDAPAEAWCEALFFHENRRGRVNELWCHTHGCGSYLVIERDTATHEIFSVRLANAADHEAVRGADAGTGRSTAVEPAE
ncbi:MAG: sarcosine oxidase subunit delta [Pseudomonadota bacterium]